MDKAAVHVGDVVTIPVDQHRVAVAQVVAKYQSAHYFAVFQGTCAPDDHGCIESRLTDDIFLLALSFDAKVSVGHWEVVGRNDVDLNRIPFGAYVEGVSPPGTFDVVDYSGSRRRRITPDEAAELPPRNFVAPVRIEKAVRACHGFGPWTDTYEELRPPDEQDTTRYWFDRQPGRRRWFRRGN